MRASSRRRTRWPAARRSRANAVGADVHTRRRRLDGARRARFLVVCKYDVVWTSNARPARPREQPRRAAPPDPDSVRSARDASQDARRASSAAAQRIMTRRELQKLVLPATLVRLCHSPGAWHERRGCTGGCTYGLARRSAPKGSPSVDGAAAQSPGNLSDELSTIEGLRRCRSTTGG